MRLAGTIAMTACAGTAAAPRWVGGEGHEPAQRTRRIVAPFQLSKEGISGTALVYGFATLAARHAASAFSNLAIVLQVRRGETLIECTTRFEVGDARPDAAPDAASWEPPFEDAWVTDLDARCETHGEQVEPDAPRFENRNDDQVGQALMRRESQREIVFEERCTLHPTRRQVHRYQHYIAARFTPPDLAALNRLADVPVVVLPARCRVIPDTKPPMQRVEGDLHFSR